MGCTNSVLASECSKGEPLTCPDCKRCSQKPLASLDKCDKCCWVRHKETGVYRCRSCHIKHVTEMAKYERERKYYANAKQEMYPPISKQPTLKRIASDKEWNTASFYQCTTHPELLKLRSKIEYPLVEDEDDIEEEESSSSGRGDQQQNPESVKDCPLKELDCMVTEVGGEFVDAELVAHEEYWCSTIVDNNNINKDDGVKGISMMRRQSSRENDDPSANTGLNASSMPAEVLA